MRRLIARNGHQINLDPGKVNRERLLGALCLVESTGWKNRQPNFEPAYYVGGRYFNAELFNLSQRAADPKLRDAMGRLTASSFGPFHVMYPVAVELGFDGFPLDLQDPRVNIEFAIRYINRRIVPKIKVEPDTPEGWVIKVADGYNSGSPNDNRVPEKYIAKVLSAYDRSDLFDQLVTLPDYMAPERQHYPRMSRDG